MDKRITPDLQELIDAALNLSKRLIVIKPVFEPLGPYQKGTDCYTAWHQGFSSAKHAVQREIETAGIEVEES